MYLALFLISTGTYFFYPWSPGGPGPRYLLAYFPFLILAVADLSGWISRQHAPGPRRLWKFAMGLQIVGSVSFAAIAGYNSYGQRDLQRTARQAGDGEKIFFLRQAYHGRVADMTRNPPVLSSANSLYFDFDWGDEPERDAIRKRFPGRKIFVYEYPAHLYRVPDNR